MDIKEEIISKRILITGITGFLGAQIAHECLIRNYIVRGTVRSLKNQKKLLFIKNLPGGNKVELTEADLLNDKGWKDSCKNCDYVIHAASPYPLISPGDENQLIKPAVEGTLRVLKAAKENGVKKIVITSSIAAIISFEDNKLDLDESHWSDVTKISAYSKSKNLAEQAAWKFIRSQDPTNKMELSVINPGFILGPSLVTTDFSSGELIRKLMMNDLFGIPDVCWGIVDVRDCAIAHVNALERAESNNKRFILVSGSLTMLQIIQILKEKYEKYGYSFPSHEIWQCTLKVAALCSAEAKELLPFWGLRHRWNNELSKKILGICYKNPPEAVLEMANSLIQNGIVPDYVNHPKPKGCCS